MVSFLIFVAVAAAGLIILTICWTTFNKRKLRRHAEEGQAYMVEKREEMRVEKDKLRQDSIAHQKAAAKARAAAGPPR